MIDSAEIKKMMIAALDAEETLDVDEPQYYDDNRDLIPAINYAVKFIVSLINSALGQKKITEEAFSDLSKTVVVRTNNLSRFSTDILPGDMWAIRAVHPSISTATNGNEPVNVSDITKSYLRSDLVMVDIQDTADRLNIEEWAQASKNPFSPGYNRLCGSLRVYAYLNPELFNMESSSQVREVSIKPSINNRDIAVSYVQMPTTITEIGQPIQLQSQVESLLVAKALNFISFKQGDTKSLNDVTERDMAILAQLLIQ